MVKTTADWLNYLAGPFPNPNGDGTYVYTLQPGARLFHGTWESITAKDIRERGNFFGADDTAMIYCQQCKAVSPDETPNLYEFALTRPLTLLAMDDCRTSNALLAHSSLRDSDLNRAFQCVARARTPERYSDRDIDRRVVSAMCNLANADGYATHAMVWAASEGGKGEEFHAELYLCDAAASTLRSVGRVTCGVCARPSLSTARRTTARKVK